MHLIPQQRALVPKFLESTMDPQQTSQNQPHVFFSVILFYMKSYSLLFS